MKINILKNKYDYPVIQDYQRFDPAFRFDDGNNNYLTIYVLQQDGIWCQGRSYSIYGDYGFGGGCAPGRKWGEWDSYESALIDTLEEMLKRFKREADNSNHESCIKRCNKVINAIEQKLLLLKTGEQAELF